MTQGTTKDKKMRIGSTESYIKSKNGGLEMTGPHCGNCIRWEDHKAWGDIGFCNDKESDTPKAGRCPKWIQNAPKAKKKNMEYIGNRPESDITGPSGPFPYSIEDDGTLVITVPKGIKVGRVLVQEEGTRYGSLFYAD